MLDPDACYRALIARDARFDGVFFVGVTTTGIYCRPVCRARTPGRPRCVFFRRPAEAERAGFRACFRCRPELAPGAATVDASSRLVAEAVARIESGALNDASLDDLAAELGVTGRHLRRTLHAELGVSPFELAQSRRLALAKQLLHDSRLSMTDVALSSGFASLRRFNATFRARFDRSPSELRRSVATSSTPSPDAIPLTLAYRAPFDWGALLAFLGARAVPGVERVAQETYLRTASVGEHTGWIAVTHEGGALRARVSPSLAKSLMPIVARLRRLFDLDARPDAIEAHLSRDKALRALVTRRPGLRVPGAFDSFEIATRAILGQQVSVRAARTLAERLVAAYGAPLASPHEGLARVFPGAARIAQANEGEIMSIGLTGARARTLVSLARAVATGRLRLEGRLDVDALIGELVALPGIGPWTAQYIAMRALGAPDAFPDGDLVLRRALDARSRRDVLARAEAWRPWRAYAAVHLWTSMAGDER
jgi:AraC family transcriptional regulator of adaptative response / DNA-3-methyladenine glycosylase II